MADADPVKTNRSKAIQGELTACRDRVRLLVEDKVGKFIFQTFVTLTTTSRIHLTPPFLNTQENFSLDCRVPLCLVSMMGFSGKYPTSKTVSVSRSTPCGFA